MDQFIIEAMVEALKPALKNPKRTQEILEKFWTDKMALVWDTEDVHRAANERRLALTQAQAITVLHQMHEYHNKQYGLQWSDLTLMPSGFSRSGTEDGKHQWTFVRLSF